MFNSKMLYENSRAAKASVAKNNVLKITIYFV